MNVDSEYFSGIKVFDVSDVVNPAEINGNSVIGLVGTCTTAPDDFPSEIAQDESKKKTLKNNLPYLVTSMAAVKKFDGSIGRSLKLIYSQSGGKVVVVRAPDVDGFEDAIEAFLDAKAATNFSPEFMIAPMSATDMTYPSAAHKQKAVEKAEQLEAITLDKKTLMDEAKRLLDEDSEDDELIQAHEEALKVWNEAKGASELSRTFADSLSSTSPRFELVGMKLKAIASRL